MINNIIRKNTRPEWGGPKGIPCVWLLFLPTIRDGGRTRQNGRMSCPRLRAGTGLRARLLYPRDPDTSTATDDHPLVVENDNTFAHVQNLKPSPGAHTSQRGHVSLYSITGVLTRFAPSPATCVPVSRGPHPYYAF